jgi:pyruvate dehydrogenase phosphatase
LTTDHHVSNPAELARIRSQHPDETDCVVDGRILGALAVTRGIRPSRLSVCGADPPAFSAVGDHAFKLPPAYSRRIFANVERSSRSVPPDVILARNRTPPYIISTPEVTHTRLPPRPASRTGAPIAVLILASDGLAALDDERTTAAELARCWTESAARPASAAEQEAGWADALSLRILRDALGGRDASRVSAMLTVEMMDRWMDDTTIMVCQL